MAESEYAHQFFYPALFILISGFRIERGVLNLDNVRGLELRVSKKAGGRFQILVMVTHEVGLNPSCPDQVVSCRFFRVR
jgi:hypothetical protein